MRHTRERVTHGGGRPPVRRANSVHTGSWLLRTTLRRTRTQWRLLLGVIAVAVLANVLVTSLSLLVSATEEGGVRGALSAIPTEQVDLGVRLVDPTVALAEGRATVTDAVDSVFAPAATTTSSGMALSRFEGVSTVGGIPLANAPITFAYFGEFDGIAESATLVAGEWPAATGAMEGTIEVAVPAAAATGMSIDVGATIVTEAGGADVSAVVTAIYEPHNPTDEFWALDRLAGAGFDPAFPDPFKSFYSPTVVLGPLVVSDGALASAGIPVAFADLRYTPDFSQTTVSQVQPLLDRLQSADVEIPYLSNGVAGSIFLESDAAPAVSAVAAGLVVTRSTVVVVSLLLVVLAVAAMAQLARLFDDARAGERQLMRARGASRRNILALAILEAAALAAVTAAVTPPLAALVYRALAAQPPMVAANMPPDAGLPPASWLIAAGISLVFVLVLVAPLVRGNESSPEGARAAGRQRGGSGIARSGIDLALVVLAGVAYWQLQTYRTPVRDGASLAVDPVLVAGPALVLVALALVCVRLIPAASRLLERLGSGSRGATVALASWEIGRRSHRATAAVLLLSLTLAVGTFGLCFLTTWKQSQLDQAAFAVGAPVRVEATGAAANVVAPAADGTPAEPAMRRPMLIGGLGIDPDNAGGIISSVMALTPAARQLAAAGRLHDLGGNVLVDSLDGYTDQATAIDLPAGATGFAATVRIGDPAAPIAAVAADITAILEGDRGQLLLLPLGRVDADGAPHEVSGEFASGQGPVALRFAGFQAKLIDTSAESTPAMRPDTSTSVLMTDLAGLVPGDSEDAKSSSVALAPPAGERWFGSSSARATTLPATDDVPDGWRLRIAITVPSDLRSETTAYSLVGWEPNLSVPAVLGADLADKLSVPTGTSLKVRTGGAPTTIRVVAIAPLVPGATATSDLVGASPALGGSTGELAVVDATLLARSLVEVGATGPFVDEWWVDVAADEAGSYIDRLPEGVIGVGVAVLGEHLQQAPLRVATQAALWVAIAASTLLAAVGFGVHSAAGLRSRRLELAQLRAIGYSRRQLVGLIATESMLMCVLGAVFGVSIGVLLAWLVGPLVAVSPTGQPTVPPVVVEVPALGIALLLAEVVAVLAAVVMIVARVQRFTEPAHLLREGSQP